MRKAATRVLNGADREPVLVELAGRPGMTLEAIGRDPRIKLSRERVRQLLEVLGVRLASESQRMEPLPPLPVHGTMSAGWLRAALEASRLKPAHAARLLQAQAIGDKFNPRTLRAWLQGPGQPRGRAIKPHQRDRILAMLETYRAQHEMEEEVRV